MGYNLHFNSFSVDIDAVDPWNYTLRTLAMFLVPSCQAETLVLSNIIYLNKEKVLRAFNLFDV